MDFPKPIDRLSMGLLIGYIKGIKDRFFFISYFSGPECCFTLSKNADPDEMQHYAKFTLGLHCSSNYTFRFSNKRYCCNCLRQN